MNNECIERGIQKAIEIMHSLNRCSVDKVTYGVLSLTLEAMKIDPVEKNYNETMEKIFEDNRIETLEISKPDPIIEKLKEENKFLSDKIETMVYFAEKAKCENCGLLELNSRLMDDIDKVRAEEINERIGKDEN